MHPLTMLYTFIVTCTLSTISYTTTPKLSAQTQHAINISTLLIKAYTWFNTAIDPQNSLDLSELSTMVTPDFVWWSSETEWAANYNALCDLIAELRNGDYLLSIDLPFKEIIISEDYRTCVVRYTIQKKYHDNTIQKEHVIAIWNIAPDGRLQRIHEVSNITLPRMAS